MTFKDILTAVLVSADYPEVKRAGFVNTFYEYLLIRLMEEIEKSDSELYQKLEGYFNNPGDGREQIKEGMQEAYKNPVLKEKMDGIIDEITEEISTDITSYATEDQKQKIISSLPQG